MAWREQTRLKRNSQAEAIGLEIVREPILPPDEVEVRYVKCGHTRTVPESRLASQNVGRCFKCSAERKIDDLVLQARLIARKEDLSPRNFTI
jgi:hypothetical protein